MRNIALMVAAAAAVLSGPVLQAREVPKGEEQLARVLKDRVAGEPVSCINLSSARSSRIIDKTAIVYDAGSVIYVNRPRNPGSLDSSDVMVIRPTNNQLCSVDTVHLRDSSNWFYTGFVGLDKFVPYRRVARN